MPAPLPSPAQTRMIMSAIGVQVSPEFGTILDAEPRELVISGGWRGGKSTVLAGKVMKRIPFQLAWGHSLKRNSLYWLVGPDYDQVRQEFRYVLSWARKLNLVEYLSDPKEGQWEMRLRDAANCPDSTLTIETKSAGHTERLGSVAPDYIGVCEAGQCDGETRTMMIGRAAEKRANICYAGTLEDDEGHAQWAWYQELAAAWDSGAECEYQGVGGHVCSAEHNSYRLPTWANTFVYPGGRTDPEILRIEQLHRDDPYTFKRKYAGEPTGVQFAVYHQALPKRDILLRTMDQASALQPVLKGVGGLDFGTVHPSVLVVGHQIEDIRDKQTSFVGPRGIIWVKEVRWLETDPGNAFKLQKARKELSDRWHIWNWNVDPNERYLANSFQGQATSYSESAREARVSLLTARLDLNKVYFDRGGPGVEKLYDQLQRIHRRKTASGELKYVRMDDDGVAALEDMVEAIDGSKQRALPTGGAMTKPKYGRRKREYVGV